MSKAWIVLDEQFPVYSVSFEKNDTCGDAIEVELTPEEATFIRVYEVSKTLYEEMCSKLVGRN